MRIKLDENLPAELVDDLRALGHDTDSIVSEGLAGAVDVVVVREARRAQRVLFTLDKGLGDVRAYPAGRHGGIVLFRPPAAGRGTVREFIRTAVGKGSIAAAAPGRLVVLTATRVRVWPMRARRS